MHGAGSRCNPQGSEPLRASGTIRERAADEEELRGKGVAPFYCGRPTTTLYLPKQNGNGHTDVDHLGDRSGNSP